MYLKNYTKFTLVLVFFLLFQSNIPLKAQECSRSEKTRIMLVGDSWGHFTWVYRSFKEALNRHGFEDINEDGARTVLISMQADGWNNPSGRRIIRSQATSLIDADVFVVILTGNDVFWKWEKGMSYEMMLPYGEEALREVDSIIDILKEVRPNAKIIIPSYDYPNFSETVVNQEWNPYWGNWESFGFASPFEMNQGLKFYEDWRKEWPRYVADTNIIYVNALGLMQYTFGQPTPSLFEPFGTYPPKSVTLPYGDLRYPSPKAAMGLNEWDAFHLGPEGYNVYCGHILDKFLSEYFRKNPTAVIKSKTGAADGWVRTDGAVGSGEMIIGKDGSSKEYAGIVTINTADIPANAEISSGSLFLTRKGSSGSSPFANIFPAQPRVDIKKGIFGSSEAPEKSDYSEAATVNDVGCWVGDASENKHKIRIDLDSNALLAINKGGLTQFRIKFKLQGQAGPKLLTFYDGAAEEEFWAPSLDLKYVLGSPTTAIKDEVVKPAFIIYPNPARSNITFDIPETMKKTGFQINVLNTVGAVLKTIMVNPLNNYSYNLAINDLPDGAYVLQLNGDGQIQSRTFVVVK